ncbi:MAG: hypothetical protein LBL13_13610, partial [Bacteroidales bacterium]|nr:hypothetical protein [Bacteroidales bacterium]
MKFTEEKLERVFTELLEQEGYTHCLGATIVRPVDEVLIEDDLRRFLLTQYQSEGITETEVQTI